MRTAKRDQSISQSNEDALSCAPGKKDANRCAPVVERPRLFAGISPAEYKEICRAARMTQFTRGEMLHLEGDPVGGVILITSGCVKLTKSGQEGSEVILRLAVRGDFLGTEGLLGCGEYGATAEVLRTCQALVWDIRALKKLVERYPVVRQNLMAILDEHLRELEDRFREVATEKVGARVGLQLLRLLKSMGQPVSVGVEIALSREDLARMTGTTLFTVSRLLSAWEARGVVRSRREAVAICDAPTLGAISQEDSQE